MVVGGFLDLQQLPLNASPAPGAMVHLPHLPAASKRARPTPADDAPWEEVVRKYLRRRPSVVPELSIARSHRRQSWAVHFLLLVRTPCLCRSARRGGLVLVQLNHLVWTLHGEFGVALCGFVGTKYSESFRYHLCYDLFSAWLLSTCSCSLFTHALNRVGSGGVGCVLCVIHSAFHRSDDSTC
jgi:hypothetical protein